MRQADIDAANAADKRANRRALILGVLELLSSCSFVVLAGHALSEGHTVMALAMAFFGGNQFRSATSRRPTYEHLRQLDEGARTRDAKAWRVVAKRFESGADGVGIHRDGRIKDSR